MRNYQTLACVLIGFSIHAAAFSADKAQCESAWKASPAYQTCGKNGNAFSDANVFADKDQCGIQVGCKASSAIKKCDMTSRNDEGKCAGPDGTVHNMRMFSFSDIKKLTNNEGYLTINK